MHNKIYFPQQPIQPLSSKQHESPSKQVSKSNSNFAQVLDNKLKEPLKFSNHAMQRLHSRNIKLSDDDLQKLQEAVSKVREKGSRDSLVLMQDLALVVSVKNNTVITAVDGDSLKENVFTNIDSAVIV